MSDRARELLRMTLSMLDCQANMEPESFEFEYLAEEIRAYLSNTSNDAEEPTKIEIAAEHEDIDWQSNEGAVYLFAGWLTTRDTVISCGRTENASPMAEAIKEYKAEWPERFTKLAEPEVKREPLHLNDVVKAFNDSEACGIMDNFIAGVLFAEKHHGIGGGDE